MELYSPSGGSWGSSYINTQFEALLDDLFGKEHISQVKSSADWYGVMDVFENAKINFSPEDPVANVSVNLIIPRDALDQTFKNQINEYNAKKGTKLELTRGTLRLASVIPMLFDPIISNITNHIATLLQKSELRQVRYLFLVGGFAESPLLQSRIEKEFGGRVKVVIPPRPSTAVVNGAVRYGLDPGVICERVMPETIGMQVSDPWNDSLHAGRTKVTNEFGMRFCSDCFDPFVAAGEKIMANQQIERSYIPAWNNQTKMRLSVYGSPNPAVTFVTDKGTKIIGYLDVDIPDVGAPMFTRYVDASMKFGGTTILVTATYRRTGKSVNAKFAFMLDEMPTIASLRI